MNFVNITQKIFSNHAKGYRTHTDENPPVGLILCAQKDSTMAHYALEGLPNKMLDAEYCMSPLDEKTLAAEHERARRMLMAKQRISFYPFGAYVFIIQLQGVLPPAISLTAFQA